MQRVAYVAVCDKAALYLEPNFSHWPCMHHSDFRPKSNV